MNKITTEEFIERARKTHGDKYDYSKVDMDNRDEKDRVCIICPIHGEFWQTPSDHYKHGCKKCGIIERSKKRKGIKTGRTPCNKKYTYEYCYNCAKQCKTLKDFRENYSREYKASVVHGWRKDYDWLYKIDITKGYSIYAFIDKENKTCYVGLSCNLSERIKKHKNDNKSAVFRYFNSLKKEIPQPIILKDNLNSEEAQYYEHYFVEKYKIEGWNLLNKAKTGIKSSSLGSLNKKLTKEIIFGQAKECKTRREFWRKHSAAYQIALKNGWIKELFPEILHKPPFYWNNFDRILEVSQKVNSRSELARKYGSAYKFAIQNEWMDEIAKKNGWERKRREWNKETILEESYKCKNLRDFFKKYNSAYQFASKHNLLNEIVDYNKWNKRKLKWEIDEIIEESKKHNTFSDFINNSEGAYKAALKYKIIDKILVLNKWKKGCNIYTFEDCLNIVKQYKKSGDVWKYNNKIYAYIVRHHWLNQIKNELGWE